MLMRVLSQEPSERIIDRYAIYDQIAAGGMAVVHFGRLLGQAGFSRTVAIKRLHPQFASDPEFVAMFLDEAHLAVRVQHPNVVAPLDVVVADGELLVVMDYVSGETLAQLLRQAALGDGVQPGIIASVLVDTLYGLHAAHDAMGEDGAPLNIVHRDVSPQNIIVGVDGAARVLDFGVAKAAMRSHATKEGEIKGKVAYMAPEQLRSQAIDRRTDVFAAGVVMWEALAGRRLFRGDDLGQTIDRVLHGQIEPPSVFNARVESSLDAVVMRALERDAALRFNTAREFAVAIERATSLASPSEVADWVRRTGGSKLAQRIERVAMIESRSSSRLRVTARSPLHTPLGFEAPALPPLPSAANVRPLVVVPPADELPTVRPPMPSLDVVAPVDEQPAPAAPFPKKPVLAVAVLALALGIAVAWWGRKPARETAPEAAARPTSAAPVPAPVTAAATPTSDPQQEPSPPVVAAPAATSGTKLKSKAGATTSAAATARSTAKPQKPAKTAGCNPPYFVDEKGIRRVKPECL
jgi:eukaryotic-like serine/threonine-protein kinase